MPRPCQCVETLQAQGVNEEASGAIADIIAALRAPLSAAFQQQACTISFAHLIDFDWTVKLVLASSKLATVKEPAMQLTLTVSETNATAPAPVVKGSGHTVLSAAGNRDKGGSSSNAGLRQVQMEFSKVQLDALLKQCDDIEAAAKPFG